MIPNMTHSVSVIIPTHNRDDLLSTAVQSFAEQTMSPIEIIVVDDANSKWDESSLRSILNNQNISVRFIRNPDCGASSSRNLGAQIATGDILSFLDDDDYVLPNYLETMLGSLQSGIDACVCWTLSEDRGVQRLRKKTNINQVCLDRYDRLSGVTGSNFIIRKTAFQKTKGFDPKLYCYNDKDFFVRFLSEGHNVGVVEEPLVVMRQHEGDRLTSINPKRLDGLYAYFNKHKKAMGFARRFKFVNKLLLNRFFYKRSFSLLPLLLIRTMFVGELRKTIYLIRNR